MQKHSVFYFAQKKQRSDTVESIKMMTTNTWKILLTVAIVILKELLEEEEKKT